MTTAVRYEGRRYPPDTFIGPGQETGGALPGGYRQRPVITWLSCYGFSVARAWLACTAALVALAGALELAANGL